ncbi:unnamed protein product [Dimorphilus gyrociliatus]|uniref:BHLH domain-containing protein n=1 Tax=Dimorphilus gyrociliatus TaxID=2664684 RepID=A0A7I8V673_9ANNE|nr:unnamed protein product [Dimorphilus gyrociliatus]
MEGIQEPTQCRYSCPYGVDDWATNWTSSFRPVFFEHTRIVASARRNERERNRVKHINSSFAVLRQKLPSSSGKKRKLSKVDTLRGAIDYIRHLQKLLKKTGGGHVEDEDETEDDEDMIDDKVSDEQNRSNSPKNER